MIEGAASGLALLALPAALAFGVGDFLGGTIARKVPLLTVLVISQLVATFSVIPRLVIEPIGGDVGPAVAWGAFSGVAAAVGVSALYKGLAIGTMGVVAPLSSLSVLVPLIAGLVTGDVLGPLLIVGLAIAIVGTVLAGGPELRASDGGKSGARAIALALVAALGFGASNLGVAWGSAHDVSATLLANVVVTLVAYTVVSLVVRRWPRAGGLPLLGIIAIGVLGFVANLLFAIASQSGMLSVVAVLASLFPAVTVLLGWWVHGERLKPVQVIGVVFVLAGAVIIAGFP